MDVRPSSGWDQRVADEKADEIEVHFTRGGTDWKFEVELDRDNMEVSKEQEIRQADAGTYPVGDAGEVDFRADGDSLTLGDVRTNEGWEVTKRDESTDEIEIDFVRGDATAEFEAETGSGGIELEIDQKVTGPIPN